MIKPRDVDVAWAAGLFDGEGCVEAKNSKGKDNILYPYVRLRVEMQCVHTISRLQGLFGGSLSCHHREDRDYPMFRWQQGVTQGVLDTARLLVPHSVEKQQQLLLAIELMEMPRNRREERVDLVKTISLLKHPNYTAKGSHVGVYL